MTKVDVKKLETKLYRTVWQVFRCLELWTGLGDS